MHQKPPTTLTQEDAPPTRFERGLEALDTPVTSYYGLIMVVGLLVVFGLFMVLSSSSVDAMSHGKSPFGEFFNQAKFALIGLVPMIAASFVPVGWYRRLAWILLIGGLLLQSLVLSPLGSTVGGNSNWIKIGSLTMQPSEALKLALVVWLGMVLTRYGKNMNRLSYLLGIPVLGIVASLGMVLVGGDLGTSIIITLMSFACLWAAGVPKRYLATGILAAGVAVYLLSVTQASRLRRIMAFFSPDCNLAKECYQSNHGLQGLAQGGWFGLGLGSSRQKWGLLPEASNDFIFSIIGEELGLAGTLLVLFLFFMLALMMFRIVRRHKDPFVKIVATGVAAWIISQAVVNITVVVGWAPVLGVPLPLISNGGSALTVTMTAMGMLLAFARTEPGAPDALKAHAASLRASVSVLPGAAAERKTLRRTPVRQDRATEPARSILLSRERGTSRRRS